MNRKAMVIAAATAALVAAIGGGLYFFNRDAPPSLEVTDAGDSTAAPAGDGAGQWTIAEGSEAGYRVREKLARLPAKSDAVGRTSDVTGGLTVVEAGSELVARNLNVEVDLTTLQSDEQKRDNRIRTHGLESDRYPKATFVSTADTPVPDALRAGEEVSLEVAGRLTIHGVTQNVTVPVTAKLVGEKAEVAGSIRFPMADFDIQPPNIANIVTVDPDATMEFKLILEQ